MDMMTAQLVPALCARIYIPKREGSIAQRAIDVGAKKTHHFSFKCNREEL
jgi:hypothetical protein